MTDIVINHQIIQIKCHQIRPKQQYPFLTTIPLSRHHHPRPTCIRKYGSLHPNQSRKTM